MGIQRWQRLAASAFVACAALEIVLFCEVSEACAPINRVVLNMRAR